MEKVLAVLAQAGVEPPHACRITAYCCDKPAYLAARKPLGAIWRDCMRQHHPAVGRIFVAGLRYNPGKIELEATAVLRSA